jgi:hypothetical protein
MGDLAGEHLAAPQPGPDRVGDLVEPRHVLPDAQCGVFLTGDQQRRLRQVDGVVGQRQQCGQRPARFWRIAHGNLFYRSKPHD